MQPAEGEELAKANRAAWVETSAKNNINVGTLLITFGLDFVRCQLTVFSGSQSLRIVSRGDRATGAD